MDTQSLSSFAFKRRIFFPEQLRFLGNQSPSDPVRLLLRNPAGTFKTAFCQAKGRELGGVVVFQALQTLCRGDEHQH